MIAVVGQVRGHEVSPWNTTAQFFAGGPVQTRYKVFLWRWQRYYVMSYVFVRVKQVCPLHCKSNTFVAAIWFVVKFWSSRAFRAVRGIIDDQGWCWKKFTRLLSSMFRSSFCFMSLSLLDIADSMTLSFCCFVIIMLIEGDDGVKGERWVVRG